MLNQIQDITLEQERKDNLELFSNYFVEALQYGNNYVLQDLNYGLIELLDSDINFKIELDRIILNNQEKIGKAPIEIDGKMVEPTIANWIKDFIKFGLIDKGMDFDKAKYFSQSKNFLELKEDDKNLIARLLDCYFQLKFFPDTLDNIPVDNWYILPYNLTTVETKVEEKKRVLREVMKERAEGKPIISKEEQLLEKYHHTLADYSSVDLEKLDLTRQTQNDSGLLIDKLIEAAIQKKAVTALGILELLVENKRLELLKTDGKLVLLFQQDKKMPADFWTGGFNLGYLINFLQWLFIDKLGLSENNAAVFALRLANILRRNGDDGFMKIAYGDQTTNTFKFS